MEFTTPDFSPLLPEIFLLSAVCAVLIVDVFLKDSQRDITYLLAQGSLLGTLLLTVFYPVQETIITFSGHFVRDPLADILKVTLYIITAVVFLYSRDYLKERQLFQGEYYVLGLFGVLGMMVLISAQSFLVLYLGLELLALSQYALVAFKRDDPNAAEAAMKYFVLGALASGMLLYGISMTYGATGHLEIHLVAEAIAGQGTDNLVLVFGLVFLVVGLAFKLGAVPFHMWLPDVYQGAPTSVTLYIGAAPKLAAFAMAIRILVDATASLQSDWQQMLIILAVLSMGLGNVVALVQDNLKRLLAYSTIAHVGFLLLGIIAGTEEGYAAAMFYTITYTIMVTGAFGIMLAVSRAGFEAEYIQDYRGLNQRDPWLALMMLLVMMSMAGIPFLVGFYAKLLVFRAIISEGLVWLAIYGVVMSVIGAFYYLRVVKTVYFDPPDEESTVPKQPKVMAMDMQVVISANGLALVALGIYPTGLMALCLAAFAVAP